jgi:hypothetical protein
MALAVGAGLWLTGSPAEQRLLRLDERRVNDLRRIADAVQLYWARNARLPAGLADLTSLGGPVSTEDPETGVAYEFRPKEPATFELCATFARPSEDVSRDYDFTHPAGRQCFERPADRRNRTRADVPAPPPL